MSASSSSVAVVTGGGSGLGLSMAYELARNGHAVGLVGRSQERLDRARSQLEAEGFTCAVAPGDVRSAAELGEAIGAIESALGPADVAVHAAGVMVALGPLWEADERAWRADFDTSIVGGFLLAQRVLPSMVSRRRGRLIVVLSGVAFRPSPYRTGYAAGKAALMNLVESLASELEPHSVRAFAVAPGFADTDMTRSMANSPWSRELDHSEVVPAGRSAELVARIAAGDADLLSGRLLHALDDLDEMLAHLQEIADAELYVPRVRRLESTDGV